MNRIINFVCEHFYNAISFLNSKCLALNAHLVVMPFFEQERNMFYRHQSSLMYSQKSFTLALFFSELPFILLVGMVFSVCFYFLLGTSFFSSHHFSSKIQFRGVFFSHQSVLLFISYLTTAGFAAEASKFFYFYLFVTLNVAYWAFLGQLFTSILPDAVAAVGIGCLFFPIVNLFAGEYTNVATVELRMQYQIPLLYVLTRSRMFPLK